MHALARGGVAEGEARGDEAHALGVLVAASVARVAHDRKAQHVQVAADLVQAPRGDAHAHRAHVARGVVGQHLVLGERGLAVERELHAAGPAVGGGEVAPHLGEVDLLHLHGLELAREVGGGRTRVGEDHEPLRLAVQAVDQVGPASGRDRLFHLAEDGDVVAVAGALREQAGRLEPYAVGLAVGDAARLRGLQVEDARVVVELDPVAGGEGRLGAPQPGAFAAGARTGHPDGALAHGVLDRALAEARVERQEVGRGARVRGAHAPGQRDAPRRALVQQRVGAVLVAGHRVPSPARWQGMRNLARCARRFQARKCIKKVQ